MSQWKISAADINGAHVEGNPRILKGTVIQNQQVFDKYCDMIAGKFNDFVDHVEDDLGVNIAEETIEAYEALGWVND